jgi:hypothetical protein
VVNDRAASSKGPQSAALREIVLRAGHAPRLLTNATSEQMVEPLTSGSSSARASRRHIVDSGVATSDLAKEGRR